MECSEKSTEVIIESSEVLDTSFMPHLSAPGPRCVLIGKQSVIKFDKHNSERDAQANIDFVQIFLVVVRLPEVGTDVLITLNAPYAQVKDRHSQLS